MRSATGRVTRRRAPDQGFTLVELAVAASVFAVIALAAAMTLLRGMEYRQQSFQAYRAMMALRDRVAEIQDTANRPQRLTTQEGIGAVYDKYHGGSFAVPDLASGQISITCFADENTVPAPLGGPQDLNLDGDAMDNLAAAGYDLKLVPLRLTLTYDLRGTSQSLTLYRLVTKTTN